MAMENGAAPTARALCEEPVEAFGLARSTQPPPKSLASCVSPMVLSVLIEL